ncbi:MAG: Transcriptional regulator, AcrR family, partial [uncultured Thermomicrobiales bacterium]
GRRRRQGQPDDHPRPGGGSLRTERLRRDRGAGDRHGRRGDEANPLPLLREQGRCPEHPLRGTLRAVPGRPRPGGGGRREPHRSPAADRRGVLHVRPLPHCSLPHLPRVLFRFARQRSGHDRPCVHPAPAPDPAGALRVGQRTQRQHARPRAGLRQHPDRRHQRTDRALLRRAGPPGRSRRLADGAALLLRDSLL